MIILNQFLTQHDRRTALDVTLYAELSQQNYMEYV